MIGAITHAPDGIFFMTMAGFVWLGFDIGRKLA